MVVVERGGSRSGGRRCNGWGRDEGGMGENGVRLGGTRE